MSGASDIFEVACRSSEKSRDAVKRPGSPGWQPFATCSPRRTRGPAWPGTPPRVSRGRSHFMAPSTLVARAIKGAWNSLEISGEVESAAGFCAPADFRAFLHEG